MPNVKISKKTVNLTIDPDLYLRAKAEGFNLSAILGKAVSIELKEAEAKHWRQKNRLALEELNRITEAHGLLSDDDRAF